MEIELFTWFMQLMRAVVNVITDIFTSTPPPF